MYFDGDVSFNGDCLEILEYRHDWASFRFTIELYRFFLLGMIPEVIMHTRSQGNMPIQIMESICLHHTQMKNRSATIMTAVMIFTDGFLAHV